MKGPSEYFRAGVGILVISSDGKVLALRRADTESTEWQLPQGGLDRGELPLEAALRELQEETGIGPAGVELIETGDWIAYELPDVWRSTRTGRGQVLRWHIFRFAGEDEDIKPDGNEFSAWRWMTMSQLTDAVAAFRQPAYRQLALQCAGLLAR